MTLFSAAIRRPSVCLIRFTFLCYIEVFSCEILFVIILIIVKVYHTSISCRIFSAVWETASLLESPAPFSVF